MGSEGEEEPAEPFAIAAFDWDLAAEEELRNIEASYTSKRRTGAGHHVQVTASGPRSPRRRRLPNWGSASGIQSPVHTGARDGTPQRGSTDGTTPESGVCSLAPRPCRVNIKVRHPAMNFGGRIVYCRTGPEVEQATMELLDKIKAMKQTADQISLGFDIEWKPMFRRGEALRKAAVMQMCMDTAHCYVMHIIHSGIPPILQSLLEDCSSVKVGICIAGDAMKIWRDYNVSVEPLEDLSVIANLKLGQAPKQWSLSSLTETLVCKELAKPRNIRLGNWEADKLSREQLQYAATDAFVSWYLYEVLMSFPDTKFDNENVEKANDVAS